MPTTKADLERSGLVQAHAIGRMLDVTPQHVSVLVREPYNLPVAKRGRGRVGNLYDLHEVHKWDLDRKIERAEEGTLAAEQLRKVTAEADKLEILNAEQRGELIRATAAADTILTAIVALRSHMRGLAGRLAGDVAREANAAVCQRILQVELDRVMDGYAEDLAKLSETLADLEDSELGGEDPAGQECH